MLPQFRHSFDPALDVAVRSEAVGLDGVFVFDHLWPIGRPDRPVLSSVVLLGALAARTTTIRLGTLVARVGLVPDAVLVNALTSVDKIARGRLIAGLGTGDSLNRAENHAYGVAFAPAPQRIAALIGCSRALRAAGIPTWAGGRSAALREAAVGAPTDAWNAWGASVATLAAEAPPVQAAGCEVTWAGQVLVAATRAEAEAKVESHGGARSELFVGGVDDLAAHFRSLADIGITWAVCAPLDIGTDPAVPEILAEAAQIAG